MIELAFKNSELIKLLIKRGQAIVAADFNTVKEIESVINDKKSNPDTLDKYSEPSTAFIVFKDDFGQNLACKYFSKKVKNRPLFLGEKIEMKEADEPTNILWQNKEHSAAKLTYRMTKTLVICTFLLLLSIVLITYMKKKEIDQVSKYPPVDCDNKVSQFGKRM